MKIHSRLTAMLDESGLPWEARPGKKHVKIFLCGRMVAVVSHSRGPDSAHGDKNSIAHIRKVISEARA